MKKIFLVLCALCFAACTTNGPQKALDDAAKAMEQNNPQAFLANFDLNIYTTNYLATITRNDKALNVLNSLGGLLGLGNIDNLITSFMDVEGDVRDKFQMGVSTGELMAQCKIADTPDCPWVPVSLRNASIVEIGQDAAVAKVTTPANLTSWLALHKFGEKWLIVGLAPLEAQARNYAQKLPAAKNTTPVPQPEIPAVPKNKGSQKAPVHI